MEHNIHYNTIAKAIHFIKHNSAEQPSLDEIASHVNLSKYHFQRTFKKWAGISPKDYLQFITLEKSKALLKKGQSALETTYDVGLSSNSRLHELFVKIEGCTPGEFKQKGKGLSVYYDTIQTPFGNAMIVETKKGISNISFEGELPLQLQHQYANATFIKRLSKNGTLVQQYFQDWKTPQTTITLDLIGTPFQIQVWKALLKVPSSHLLSYQNIAGLIDNEKAVRAVGTAVANNPIAYLIPCHRVIKNDGQMGNYRWDPNRKVAINSYEAIHLS